MTQEENRGGEVELNKFCYRLDEADRRGGARGYGWGQVRWGLKIWVSPYLTIRIPSLFCVAEVLSKQQDECLWQ
jgi:hypothetical protein